MTDYVLQKGTVLMQTFENGQLVETKVKHNRRVYQNDSGGWRMFVDKGRRRTPITLIGHMTFQYATHIGTAERTEMDEVLAALKEDA